MSYLKDSLGSGPSSALASWVTRQVTHLLWASVSHLKNRGDDSSG